MTQPLIDHTDGHTRLHRNRGMGVPQIMQTDPGQLEWSTTSERPYVNASRSLPSRFESPTGGEAIGCQADHEYLGAHPQSRPPC